MDSTTSPPLTNGHRSTLPNNTITNDDAPYDSESDLSEIRDPPAVDTSLSTSSSPAQQSEFGHQDLHSSESSGPENEDASDDADFDLDDSPAAVRASTGRNDRSTSHDSRRPSKRKLGFEDDEHILANPALYGLRRSVCFAYPHVWPC